MYFNPFEGSTWEPAAANARIRFYWFIYASYFLSLFLLFSLLEYAGVQRNTRDVLHTSALASNVFTDFYSNTYTSTENMPTVIASLLNTYRKREGITVLRQSSIERANRIVECFDNFVDFHYYILDRHTYFGCKPILLQAENYVPLGLLEDFIVYLFNHQEVLKCFCSYDYFPLTYTAKRLLFTGRHTTLFLVGIIVNSLLVFYSNIGPGELYAFNFFLARPMENISAVLFTYIYEFIFIRLSALLEANMDKSLDIRKFIYYLLCFAFLLVIVVILILGCIFTTPTNSDNQPYQSRIGRLDTFILQIQFSLFITDFVYSVLKFVPNLYCSIGLSYRRSDKGSVYPLLLIGQRFIESEYFVNRNINDSDKNHSSNYYYYKKILWFYFEIYLSSSLAARVGLVEVSKSKDVQLRDTSHTGNGTEANVDHVGTRITMVENISNPMYSSTVN